MISVVDYGLGNVGSIVSMLRKLNEQSCIARTGNEILAATKLIVPGVGSYDAAVKNLKQRGLWYPLIEKVTVDRIPILGICLGMQLFANGSDEGVCDGFGWIPARFVRFSMPPESKLRIPHMGWNIVKPVRPSKLFPHPNEIQRFYFVHSFKAVCESSEDVLCTTNYGGDFVSGFARDNIFGVQFHPEKSHRFGLALFSAFIRV